MNVSPVMIQRIVQNWDEEDTQDMIQAMVVELKKDMRHSSPREADHFMQLIDQIQDETFWENMDHLLHFSFDY